MSGMFNDLPFFSRDVVDGIAGKDGVSPTITVTDIEGGHRLTIIDAIGTKTVDVLDGAQGQQGIQGPQGKPGTNGIDGKDGANGKDGVNGKDGAAGKDGTDGRGILALIINTEGELVVSYTDNTESNLGKVVGTQGPAYVLTAEDKDAIVAEVLAALETQPEV